MNDPAFPNPMLGKFDVFGPGYSVQAPNEGPYGDGPCAGAALGDSSDSMSDACLEWALRGYAQMAIDSGGWSDQEVHGIADDSWETIPLAVYTNHLDFIKSQVDAYQLWMDTPSTVVKYRFAREACAAPVVSGNSLVFGALSADCQRFATVLSWIVRPTVGAPSAVTATQAGVAVATRALGDGSFLVDADPSSGDVTLSAN